MNSWEICQLKRLKNNFIWKETSQRMRELSSPFFTRFYYVFLIRKNYLSESINFELGLCISSKYFLTLSGIIISIDWRLIQKSRWLEFLEIMRDLWGWAFCTTRSCRDKTRVWPPQVKNSSHLLFWIKRQSVLIIMPESVRKYLPSQRLLKVDRFWKRTPIFFLNSDEKKHNRI